MIHMSQSRKEKLLQLIMMRLTVIYQQFLSKIRSKEETEKKKSFLSLFLLPCIRQKGPVDFLVLIFFTKSGVEKGWEVVYNGSKW